MSPEISADTTETTYQMLNPLPDGTFYFRARATGLDGRQSDYSTTNRLTLIDCSNGGVAGATATSETMLNVTPRLQHKDTRMLNMDGDQETGQGRWDSAHEVDGDWTVDNGTAVRATDLDNWYCTRASISMIVAYHGGNLSQDRISYEGYGGAAPEGDLGHAKGMWPNQNATQGNGTNVFDWAMNGASVTSSRGKPTFDEVKAWIDGQMPVLIVENSDSHSVVLDGYRDWLVLKLAHRVDPWTATAGWVLWPSWSVSEYHVAPAGVTPRSDEDIDGDGVRDTIDDSDGDGLVDFDEINRFHTDPQNPDSDYDGVPDKADVREYVFDNAGNYQPRAADWDGDGLRKERDPDNDRKTNNGSSDGCEDANHNGKLDPGETSNFDATQERGCLAPTFIGHWVNGDPNTDGITRIEIRSEANTIYLHMWGACTPTDCDWGEATTDIADANDGVLSVTWTPYFKIETQQLSVLSDGRLRVVGHAHYIDNSGRIDRDYTEYFSH